MYETLRMVHNRGADLYNSGDAAGCYRMFQGALATVQPLLADHPDLQKTIQAGLANADSYPSVARRAFALHEVIEDVRGKLRNGGKKPEEMKPEEKKPEEKKPEEMKPEEKKPEEKKPEELKPASTLWERLGGEASVKKVVDDFTDLAGNDPKVDFTRGGKYQLDDKAIEQFKKGMVDFISQNTGGPLKYKGKDMKTVHKGMGITDAEFDASVADLRKALEQNGAKPADIDSLVKVVESTRPAIVEVKSPEEPKPEEKKPDLPLDFPRPVLPKRDIPKPDVLKPEGVKPESNKPADK